MEHLQSLYQESNRLGYDIDGRINEIYVGFKEKEEMDNTVFMINEKINVFERHVKQLREEYENLVSNDQFQNSNQYYWEKKIQRLEKTL
mgnify:CR=1 FL=1